MTCETAVRRVHKLRRLARSSNPHEAASAAAKAEALIEQHRITPAMLARSRDDLTLRDVLAAAIAEMQRITRERLQRMREVRYPTPAQQQRLAEELRLREEVDRRLWALERQQRRATRQRLQVLRTRAEPCGLRIRHHRRRAGCYQVGAAGRSWVCCDGLEAVERVIAAVECRAAS